MPLPHLSLVPPLLQKDELESFGSSGHTISTAVSPRGNSLVVFATKHNVSFPCTTVLLFHAVRINRRRQPDSGSQNEDNYSSDLYFSSWENTPSNSRRKFLSDSFITLTKFNKTLSDHRNGIFDEELSEEDIVWFNGIADEYLVSLKMDKDRLNDEDPWPEAALAHTETLYAAFSLFQAIHLPSNGSLSGLVGEELLEWLNTNFIAPDSDEAVELSKLNAPWDEDGFWHYLVRCILRGLSKTALIFLETLQKHPSLLMSQHAETLVSLLTSHPRSNNFTTEQEFFYTWRQWKSRVLSFKKKLDALTDEEGEDWLPWFLEIVHILEGDKVTIKRYCESYEEGWKEAICVWGVWVDVGLRRHTLPEIVASILEELPQDPTISEENFYVALVSGQVGEAIKRANELDIWLAAHMADMMHPLGLLLDIDDADVSIRDHFLLNYAEYLLSDPSLWRIAVLYMCECGEEGRLRADEVLLRIPLELGGQKVKGKEKTIEQTNEDEMEDEGNIDTRVIEILEICKEHNRENIRREICRIAARTFTEQHRYPLAISYYSSAEDWPGVGRVVDLMLEESIVQGPADFVDSVVEIAPALQYPSSHTESIFARRLLFVVRYAEFHTRWSKGDIQDAALDVVSMFREELVPKSWWGLLLKHAGELLLQDAEIMPFDVLEVFELLRRLEVVQTNAEQGSGPEYLSALIRQLKQGGEKEALRQLESVRLGLARYFARCSVLHVGGKGKITVS